MPRTHTHTQARATVLQTKLHNLTRDTQNVQTSITKTYFHIDMSISYSCGKEHTPLQGRRNAFIEQLNNLHYQKMKAK